MIKPPMDTNKHCFFDRIKEDYQDRKPHAKTLSREELLVNSLMKIIKIV